VTAFAAITFVEFTVVTSAVGATSTVASTRLALFTLAAEILPVAVSVAVVMLLLEVMLPAFMFAVTTDDKDETVPEAVKFVPVTTPLDIRLPASTVPVAETCVAFIAGTLAVPDKTTCAPVYATALMLPATVIEFAVTVFAASR
jgi:hypothetical protein